MIVDFISVRIAKVKQQDIPSTWSQPEKIMTTTTYDMNSAMDHRLNLDLSRPGTVFWLIKEAILIEVILGLLTFWVPLLLLSLVGGKTLVRKMAWPGIIIWLALILILYSRHQAKRNYARKQMKKFVAEQRGTQDKYEIILDKDLPKWRSKLVKPSILD